MAETDLSSCDLSICSMGPIDLDEFDCWIAWDNLTPGLYVRDHWPAVCWARFAGGRVLR